MRKIPCNLENPIDNLLIDLSEKVSPFFKKLGFNPNGITTLSLIFGLISVYGLYKGCVWCAVVCMLVSYFFDNLDGFYARKYNMVTKFGDYYDHIKDILVFIIYVYILYQRNKYKLTKVGWYVVLSVLIFFTGTSVLYFGCQERYYDKIKDIPSLRWVLHIISTKEKAKNCLNLLRYVGMGTFITVLLLFTVWIEGKK
jgi:phosphatidylglycerophosphate synthase